MHSYLPTNSYSYLHLPIDMLQRETYCIPTAHAPFVRDIDFNPNKDYYMVTGGDDYKIKFWDVRKCDKPVKILEGHSHWYPLDLLHAH